MTYKKYFGTTRLSPIYKIINQGLKLHAEKKLNRKLEIYYIKKKFPSLKFITFFLYNILNLNLFFDHKFIIIKYNKCSLGRHAFSYAMRKENSYTNIFVKLFFKFKGLFIGGSIIETANYISNFTQVGYFDHGAYLNGLYLEVFSQKKKKIVYTNNRPVGLICHDLSKKKFKNYKYENFIKISDKINVNLSTISNRKSFINKKLNQSKATDFLKVVKYKKVDSTLNYEDYDYVLYAQGFVDAQLVYGYTGFSTSYDWLEFTLKFFAESKKKILVKPHPNFFDIKNSKIKNLDNEYSYKPRTDALLYKKIKDKYSKFYNITFLNEPYKNHKFLKKLNKKKHIILLYTSTSTLQCAYYGFKCITSSSMWYGDEFKISNIFSSRENYLRLLKYNFNKIEYPNQRDLFKITKKFFLNKNANFGDYHFLKVFKKNLKFNKPMKFGYDKEVKDLLEKNSIKKNIIIKELSNCIQDA